MNYKFDLNENINSAVKRVAIELIDDSVERLYNVRKTFDESIHETRKNFKKQRALLRLVRFELGDDLYKKENTLFRDTGRILSGIRDASVTVETLKYLQIQRPDEIDSDELTNLKKNLRLRTRRIRSQFKKNQELIEAIINILDKHKSQVRRWPLKRKSFIQIVPGIKLVFERGQNAFYLAKKNPSAENFHDWRKRVKYLLYHVRLLENAWPEYMNLLALKLDELSDILGIEHDLAEFRKLLQREKMLFENKAEQAKLFNLIGQERIKLQTAAKLIAPYIYFEPAKNFTQRLPVYWYQSKNLE